MSRKLMPSIEAPLSRRVITDQPIERSTLEQLLSASHPAPFFVRQQAPVEMHRAMGILVVLLATLHLLMAISMYM